MNKKLAKEKLSIYRFKNKFNSMVKKDLIDICRQHTNQLFTKNELSSFFNEIYYILYSDNLSDEEFNMFEFILISWDILDYFCFDNKEKLYYIVSSSSLLLDALSQNYENAFFSHHTASYIYGFTQPTDDIFMSKLYQSKSNIKGILDQDAINRVFSGEMRKAQKKILITSNANTYKKELYLLSQYADKSRYDLEDLGIIQKQIDESSILISSYEKLLIEVVVRPSYFPDLKSIVDIYIKSKEYVDCNKLLKILDNFNYTYPYHQCIGFLLDITKYNQQQVDLFQNIPANTDFYLVYNSSNYDLGYSEKWHLYYPKEILNYI